jgi:four helix bundle protein
MASVRTAETTAGGAPPPPDTRHPHDIPDRTAGFADRVIRLSFALPNSVTGWEIGRQLVHAGMSVGANVEEAQAAESTADFLHKMKIARKECREAKYFLVRVANAELVPRERLDNIIDEADQLVRILTAIIRNTGG